MIRETVCKKTSISINEKRTIQFLLIVYYCLNDPSGFRYCAKPDLRFQRSFPVAAKGVSRPLLLSLLQKLGEGRQHHLVLVHVLEADWRRTFPIE